MSASTQLPTYVKSIDVSKVDAGQNCRRDFPEEEIDRLAGSMEAVGLLEPIIVRPKGKRFKLVAGERRLRAARQLGWKQILANVRKLTDGEAAEIGLLENLDRQNLSAVEEAEAFRRLADLGYETSDIAELTRRSAEDVETRSLLLHLPDEWQDRIHRGELSPAAGEYLTPWTDFPEVLDAMEHALVNWPMPLTQWRRTLAEAVVSLSRSMAGNDADGPRFDVDDLSQQQRDALRIVTVKPNPRTELVRAMNTELWDRLQERAQDRFTEQEWETCTYAEAQIDVEDPEPSTNGRDRSETTADDPAPGSLQERIGNWKTDWLLGLIMRRLGEMDFGELLDVAATVDLDVRDEWRLERSFLDLHRESELRDLAEDLDVDVSQCEDAEEIRAVLLHVDPEEVPETVLSEEEAVRLAD